MNDQRILSKYVGAFVDELSRSGVNDVVISPGSRSTPLAMVIANHPTITSWVHVDERSAGFFALGIAKAQKKPVALLCSSGTAGANYYPAVIEAAQSKIPLLILTADRPPELRDNGAPQAIDQNQLFGSFPKWYMEASMPDASQSLIRYIRTVASRASAISLQAPSGPVHLNFPFRDPLVPDLSDETIYQEGRANDEPWVTVPGNSININDLEIASYVEMLMKKKGLIVVGPQEDKGLSDAVRKLSEATGFPIFADPLSNCRDMNNPMVIESYDALLKGESKTLKPEVVIRFGAMPISKAYMQYIDKLEDVHQIVVDEAGWRDPTLNSSHMVVASPFSFCQQLLENLDKDSKRVDYEWSELWQTINKKATDVLLADQSEMFEGHIFKELANLLSEESLLFVGNSMPIRDLDNFFLPKHGSPTIMGNRGANGIDGVVSTALGASVSFDYSVLIIGDLSFYHDMNGLLLGKLYGLNLTIIVMNNDGGGIFSFLPQAEKEHEKHFERLFGTPIGLDYRHAAALYGATFERASSWEEFNELFHASKNHKGLNIIEIPTDRNLNKVLHRDVFSKVSETTSAVLKEFKL
ncbi:2-succinyl-5-enolpyruvyl-6-hydroxy-3-cyclohexene-1-carboxylic-acid synthase [Alkalihalobacillus sp. CinArs1]|uniref:2-succinyl-5-enolpyruvyl-6-hydroxy-3- cyclohexene-1-carboxylic-acid synthase n=1 Tax=Alkalihalobacillus sp. CinArs1 TaxID=2995314 RepID=UPI0022DDEDDA|nr:2-succinyl-5-enolpyruvyl-6-hydroxy-3-cyclohexene-1-carboxylic-acid synthase [Alkalihalobacillus sp. CinArs1]